MNKELANQIQAQVSDLNKSLETARRNKVSVKMDILRNEQLEKSVTEQVTLDLKLIKEENILYTKK